MHLAVEQLFAPAPQRPSGHGPCRPPKPQQQSYQAFELFALGGCIDQAPAPKIQLPRQHGRQQRDDGQHHRPAQAPLGRDGLSQSHQRNAARAQQGSERRRAGQCEPRHAHHHGHGRCHGVIGQGGHGKEDQCCACKLCQIARGFVRKLCQTQAGNQGQQGAIGDGAGVVRGLGLAAKGKRHRLGTRTARQVVNAVPGCCQRQHQQRHERQSRRHFGGHQPIGCDLDGPGAQPIRQQTVGFGGHAAQ